MIYTCENCGAWFSGELIRAALEKNETIITCPYCNHVTQFRDMQQSRIAKGYDFLATGDFNSARQMFLNAIDESERMRRRDGRGEPSPDAYLGCALCDFSVQTVFDESDKNKINPPRFTLHRGRDISIAFSESTYFRKALACVEGNGRTDVYDESARIREYGNTIDAILDHYRNIEKTLRGKNYCAFIAYEDEPEDGVLNRGFEIAGKVRSDLLDAFESAQIFLPDFEDCNGDHLLYEAEILYAIEHSNCMVVISDNDIDLRLRNIFSRYLKSCRDGRNLAFLRYLDEVPINLGEFTGNLAVPKENIFDFDKGRDPYCEYVCERNHKIWKSIRAASEPVSEVEESSFGYELPFGGAEFEHRPSEGLRRVGPDLWEFGVYPQQRVTDAEVVAFFERFDLPSPYEANDWTALCYSKKTGRPYMWYRDETVGGARYRAVYFTRFRDPFSVQISDASPKEQKLQGYLPQQIYVFRFDPVVWTTVREEYNHIVLCSHLAIDSIEFCRDEEMTGEYAFSYLRGWLNGEFLSVAFTETEREELFAMGEDGDRISLINRMQDDPLFRNANYTVLGSDYFKCMGGMTREYGVDKYWVIDDGIKPGGEASVIFSAGKGEVSSQAADNTSVAVVPKIIVGI